MLCCNLLPRAFACVSWRISLLSSCLIEMHEVKGHLGQNNYAARKLIVIENENGMDAGGHYLWLFIMQRGWFFSLLFMGLLFVIFHHAVLGCFFYLFLSPHLTKPSICYDLFIMQILYFLGDHYLWSFRPPYFYEEWRTWETYSLFVYN